MGDIIREWNAYLDSGVDPYTAAVKLADMGQAAFERSMGLKESDPGTAYAILAQWRAIAQSWYARKGYGEKTDEGRPEIVRLTRVYNDVLQLWDLLTKRGAHQKSVTVAVLSGFWDGFKEGLGNVGGVFAAPFTPGSDFWKGAGVLVLVAIVVYALARR